MGDSSQQQPWWRTAPDAQHRPVSLTGDAVRWGTVVLALVAAVAVVLGWSGLARRGVLAVLARCAALAGVNALVLLAVLVSANDAFGFYSDYADLLGSTAALTTTHAGAAAGPRPAGAAAPARAPRGTGTVGSGKPGPVSRTVLDRGVPVPGRDGRVERLHVDGPSGTSGDVLVLLPPGYGDPASARTSYPVVEAFHGYPGTAEQWLDAMDLQRSLDTAVASHALAPTVVVMPTLQDPPGRDTECLDGPAGEPQMETWLTTDVVAAVESSYRVRGDRGSWATAGLSMGGWCAAEATVLHPQVYGAAMVFGGYFRYDPGPWLPFARDSAEARSHDLVAAVAAGAPPVAVWAMTSQSDPISWPTTRDFAAAVRAPTSVTVESSAGGGHRMSSWAAQVVPALTWLGSTEAGFSPTR